MRGNLLATQEIASIPQGPVMMDLQSYPEGVVVLTATLPGQPVYAQRIVIQR